MSCASGEAPCVGLSPRVRGNLFIVYVDERHYGSIPACAGEPVGVSASPLATRVYPRVCGGTLGSTRYGTVLQGLSPRVRGNPTVATCSQSPIGSIPACAGEPPPFTRLAFGSTVYPRVCGGTLSKHIWSDLIVGLSPRVRGNLTGCSGPQVAEGSIPACAGEPTAKRSCLERWRVYPRVCGGTTSTSVAAPPSEGLSPRVRGNPSHEDVAVCGEGSIPACAGEPRREPWSSRRQEVYPRVCGGTAGEGLALGTGCGLSPRVRGNLKHASGLYGRVGSIPACAGEPEAAQVAANADGVYPRVCGGTESSRASPGGTSGLSPRVRGNLWPFWPIRWEESRLSQASELRERSFLVSSQLSKNAARRTITTS